MVNDVAGGNLDRKEGMDDIRTFMLPSGAETKTAYEGEADTNAYTDSEKTIVGNTSGTNTGDEASASVTVQGIVELATIAEVNTGTDATRAVTPDSLEGSALQIKVDGIEALADVTDLTNVNAAAATIVGTVTTGTWSADTIAINKGGTGQVTAQAAIDALSAVSAATNEHVLTKDTGTGNAIWKVASSGFSDPMTTRGDIIYKNAGGTTTRLGAGTNGQVIVSDGTDIAWGAAGAADNLGDHTATEIIKSVTFGLQGQEAGHTIIGTTASGAWTYNAPTGDIHDFTINSVTALSVSSTAAAVTGNITVSGTVDGRDVATDGSKLDGIEALADVTDETNVAATASVIANTAKVTNANHTGDVTGSGALTIAAKAVDVAMLADGTDGELITWGITGVAETVAVGTLGHVLTSGGTGVAPTFQAAASGGHIIEDEGTPLTARSNLNFIGAIVAATDNTPDTDVTLGGTAANFNTACSDDTFAFISDNLSVFANTTKAQLEGILSDVSDIAEADGDVFTGVHDFGGATSLEIPNGATPTVNADGEIAIDTTVTGFDEGLIKFFSTAESGVVSMPIAQFTSPTDGHVIAYDSTGNNFELVAQTGGAGSGTNEVIVKSADQTETVNTPLQTDDELAIALEAGEYTYDLHFAISAPTTTTMQYTLEAVGGTATGNFLDTDWNAGTAQAVNAIGATQGVTGLSTVARSIQVTGYILVTVATTLTFKWAGAGGSPTATVKAGSSLTVKSTSSGGGGGFADPMTTRGDIIYKSASATTRLALGTNGQVLTSDGTDIAWAAASGGSFTLPHYIPCHLVVPEGTVAFPDIHDMVTGSLHVSSAVFPDGAATSTYNIKPILPLPEDLHGTPDLKLVIGMYPNDTEPTNINTRFTALSRWHATGEDLDQALQGETEVTIAMPTTEENMIVTTIALSTPTIAAGDLGLIQLTRDPTDGADVYAESVKLAWAYITCDRTVNA